MTIYKDVLNSPFWDPCVTIVGSAQYTLKSLSLDATFNHQSIGRFILLDFFNIIT
jgi:hypothetical protein